jgi:hypothetical protein
MLTHAGMTSEVKIKLQTRKAAPLLWFERCVDCIAAFFRPLKNSLSRQLGNL